MTAFTSKPSDTTFVEENQPITLLWDYTLVASIALARFVNVTGADREVIAIKIGSPNINVVPEYQGRFEADISITQAKLTIPTVQRSDQGKYEFDLTDDRVNTGSLLHVVDLIVQRNLYLDTFCF